MTDDRKIWYCTFGCGQKHAGKVQPIKAETMNEARALMFERYGPAWCTSYSAEQWQAEKDRPERYWPIEQELPLLHATRKATLQEATDGTTPQCATCVWKGDRQDSEGKPLNEIFSCFCARSGCYGTDVIATESCPNYYNELGGKKDE